jgi:hypothetical protein
MSYTKMASILLTLALLAFGLQAMAEIQIGWSSVSITPDKPVALAGQFHLRISRDIQDPVTATALSIETKKEGSVEQAIMVSCDLIEINPGLQARLRAGLQEKLPDFNVKKLFLNATHTHTGPETSEGIYEIPQKGVMQPAEYIEFLLEKLNQVAVSAWTHRQPGGVSWALGHAVVGSNRLSVYDNGRSIMYGLTSRQDFNHIEGYEDHGLELLFFWSIDKRMTGVLVNVACPAQVVESEEYISADFWHDVRNKLRKQYSMDLFVYPMTGASGDQSPHLLLRSKAESRLLSRMGISVREEIADRIVNAINHVYEGARMDIQNDLPFIHMVEYLDLPIRKVSKAEFEQARREYDRLLTGPQTDRNRRSLQRRNMAVIERYNKQAEEAQYRMELHVIRLGEVAIATNPFELFLDFGMQMKARSPAEQTFVAQLTGTYGAYLPSARAVAGGGYGTEIQSNLVGPEGGRKLVNRTVELLDEIFKKELR